MKGNGRERKGTEKRNGNGREGKALGRMCNYVRICLRWLVGVRHRFDDIPKYPMSRLPFDDIRHHAGKNVATFLQIRSIKTTF